MGRIAKYLKAYLGPLVLAVCLLFAQAICDLSLPNAMSNIVNVGIQQGGIEDAAPDALSADGMAFFTALMTDAQRDTVESAYTLVEDGSLQDQYPQSAEKPIYVLNGGADRGAVSAVFGETTWTLFNTLGAVEAQQGAPGTESGALSSDGSANIEDLDLTQLYAMLPVIQVLPSAVLDDAREKAASVQDTLKQESGVVLVGAMYRELGVDTDALEQSYITREGLWMLLLTLLSAGASICVSLFASRISSGLGRDLRRDVFHQVESFSNGEFDRFSTASLITRTTNDITQVQNVVMIGIRMLCYAPIMAIGGILMAVRKSLSMTWIVALAVVVLIGLVAVLFSIALPRFKKMQQFLDRLNLVARENLTGLMVTRAFSNQAFEEKRFDKSNRDLTGNQRFVNRLMSLMMPVMLFVLNGVSLLIVWVGSHQIAESQMQVGDMMAYMQYAMQIIMSFLMISAIFIMVPRASVSAGRIADVLETQPAVEDPAHPKDFVPEKAGVVEFDHVSFRYDGADEDVLHDVTFTALPGQTTALIGSTGSGKSTLVNLVPRFYDVTQGHVYVDGRDVREVRQKDLRGRIGYVPQKGVLLSGTIDSNLRYGREDATDADIRTAAEVAQATEFIDAKPEGMQSPIAQGGANVSGGQKQRLSIARALAKNPEIFIFDDSFSALDFQTDAALRKALKAHTENATILLVAQRVSTILDADQIIVLDEGKVVGKGTHKTLLKTCRTYYEIASSQLTKEELA